MKVKVCGLREFENTQKISALPIDMIGFNFYPPSSRYISVTQAKKLGELIPSEVAKVGVFVNEDLEKVKCIYTEVGLDFVQLHGDESLDYCAEISKTCQVIKVFRVDETFDMSEVYPFEACTAYFLFDTKTKLFGGSGKEFNWDILYEYKGETSFLLSGGIGPDSNIAVKLWKHKAYIGVDINSRFELEPAIKNVAEVAKFIDDIKEIKKKKIE